MAEATEINAHNNKNKSAYLYRCNSFLAYFPRIRFDVFSNLTSLFFFKSTTNNLYQVSLDTQK